MEIVKALGFGVLVFLAMVGLLGLNIAWKIWRLYRAMKRTAREMADKANALYASPLEYAEVQIEFSGVDVGLYNEIRWEFERLGFKYVADLECLSLTRTYPEARTYIRCLQDETGRINGGFYVSGDKRVKELESELSDGTFLCTTTAPGGAMMDFNSDIITHCLDPETSMEELIRHHRASLAEIAASRGVEPLALEPNTLEGAIARSNRLHAMKGRQYMERGGFGGEDIMRAARMDGGKNIDPGFAEGMADMADDVRKERMKQDHHGPS